MSRLSACPTTTDLKGTEALFNKRLNLLQQFIRADRAIDECIEVHPSVNLDLATILRLGTVRKAASAKFVMVGTTRKYLGVPTTSQTLLEFGIGRRRIGQCNRETHHSINVRARELIQKLVCPCSIIPLGSVLAQIDKFRIPFVSNEWKGWKSPSIDKVSSP